MKNRSFIAGLIAGIVLSVVFTVATSMNAAQSTQGNAKSGKYQVALAGGSSNGFPMIAEVIIDTETGQIVSRSFKNAFDYR